VCGVCVYCVWGVVCVWMLCVCMVGGVCVCVLCVCMCVFGLCVYVLCVCVCMCMCYIYVCVCVCVCAHNFWWCRCWYLKTHLHCNWKSFKQLVELINVYPVDRYLKITIHNTPTVASLYIPKVIYHIKKCKESQQRNVQIHNYYFGIYMYNTVIQSSWGKAW